MVVKAIKRKVSDEIRKAKKSGKHALGVARAATKVAKTLANPKNQAKIIGTAMKGEGLVYPGSNYIGPGNPLRGQKEKSKADRAAHKHDREYHELLRKGVNKRKLYTGFSEADGRLLKKSDLTTEHGLVTGLGMGAKRLAWKLGLTGKKIKDKDFNHDHRTV